MSPTYCILSYLESIFYYSNVDRPVTLTPRLFRLSRLQKRSVDKVVVRKLHTIKKNQRPSVPWVREPQQDRGAKTKARILDAAVHILQESSLAGLTVTNVAKRSKTSIGSIYHLFKDKQSIVHAVVDRMSHELSATAKEGLEPSRWEGVTLEDILAGYLIWSIKFHRKYGGVIQAQRVLAIQDEAIASELRKTHKQNERLMRKLILPRLERTSNSNPQLACRITIDTLRACVAQRATLYPPNSKAAPSKKSDMEWIEEIVKMISSYLSLAAPIPTRQRTAR